MEDDQAPAILGYLWKSARQLRHIIFSCLILHDRINTEVCSKENHFICLTIIVLYVMNKLLRHQGIYFGTTVSLNIVGRVYLFKIEGSQSLMNCT